MLGGSYQAHAEKEDSHINTPDIIYQFCGYGKEDHENHECSGSNPPIYPTSARP
jgi:hypothetical protein